MKIDPLKYYILDVSDFTKPRLLRFGFFPYEEAEKYIKDYITNTDSVSIVGGYKAIRKGYRMFNYTKPITAIKNYKYTYPPQYDTFRQKKTFRDKVRYHQWGHSKSDNPEFQGDVTRYLRRAIP